MLSGSPGYRNINLADSGTEEPGATCRVTFAQETKQPWLGTVPTLEYSGICKFAE